MVLWCYGYLRYGASKEIMSIIQFHYHTNSLHLIRSRSSFEPCASSLSADLNNESSSCLQSPLLIMRSCIENQIIALRFQFVT